MIEQKDLASLPFLKKSHYTGSYKELRYRIQKEEQENELILKVFAWKGIFCFDKTPLETMIQETFPFSKEGLEELRDWLNQQYKSLESK